VLSVTPTNVRIVYSWNGEGLSSWRITRHQILGEAWYWTPADAHCCPSRTYHFAISAKGGYFHETSDQRPYLGVLVQQTGGAGAVGSGLDVLQVDPQSSAYRQLLPGDVIENVLNAPRPGQGTQQPAAGSIFDKLSDLNAGQTARLQIMRGGTTLTVTVKLGSLANDTATSLIVPANNYGENVL
jgi:hypothetical protein